MKKIVFLVGTLCAFLFAFTTTTFASETTEATTPAETTVTSVETTTQEEPTTTIEATETETAVIDEEAVKEELINFIDNATNDNKAVKELTLALYGAFGVAGVFAMACVILFLYYIIKNNRVNAEFEALVDRINKANKEKNDATDKAYADAIVEIKALITKAIVSNNSAKSLEAQKKAENINNELDKIIENASK